MALAWKNTSFPATSRIKPNPLSARSVLIVPVILDSLLYGLTEISRRMIATLDRLCADDTVRSTLAAEAFGEDGNARSRHDDDLSLHILVAGGGFEPPTFGL